jgi:peptide-methionine (S)-S-oxide reductase
MNPNPNCKIKNPTYQQVCSGRSGHVEVVLVELVNPSEHFEELIRFFFGFHDPTQRYRQGGDRGTQYASFIFCSDQEQIDIARRVKDELQARIDHRQVRCFAYRKVQTQIVTFTSFTPASEQHQDYLSKNPNGYW